ncbi:MAG TPA: anthrone oxygenase family protein [Roseovarius sp.]|nr:anthrone oxygenase family protein [Roseovarius sp.]HMB13197.1 anthrone oxygenase family protein [Roseovarius sp.]
MSTFFFMLLQCAILAYALIGGVFLAFSDFIMRSLSHTGGSGGVEAMQVINREVFRWVFMALFLGMAAVSLAIVGFGATHLDHPAGALILAAGGIYLVGCFGVTVFFNVPMNEALAGMDPSEDATRAYWTGTYLPRWTYWNTVRTIACGLSAALLLFGLLCMAQAHVQTS